AADDAGELGTLALELDEAVAELLAFGRAGGVLLDGLVRGRRQPEDAVRAHAGILERKASAGPAPLPWPERTRPEGGVGPGPGTCPPTAHARPVSRAFVRLGHGRGLAPDVSAHGSRAASFQGFRPSGPWPGPGPGRVRSGPARE